MAAFREILQRLEVATAQPERLLSVQDGLASDFTALTKTLYDFQKAQEEAGPAGSPLKELVIEHFDEEQIWQELELQNNSVLNYFRKAVAVVGRDTTIRLISEKEKPAEEKLEPKGSVEDEGEKNEEVQLNKNENKTESGTSEEFSAEDSDLDFDIDELQKQTKVPQRKSQKNAPESAVDDTFFKLSEMEAFLEKVEKEDGKKRKDEEDEINYFEDIPSDEDEVKKSKTNSKSSRNLKYKHFFDPVEGNASMTENGGQDKENDEEEKQPGANEFEDFEDDAEEMFEDEEQAMEETEGSKEAKEALKKVTFDLSDESEGEELSAVLGGQDTQEEESKSSFEKRQAKLKEKMENLERAALGEKPWQLMGEVTSQKRPENSLLEEHLLFDQTARKAPVITEATTLELEDLIIQRIKDQAWDDVVRKEKLKEETFEYKKRLTLDHEKSKLSLAEVYEKEYLKQTQQQTEAEENPQHVEVQKRMDSLFLKLDALSNFHFTPKPPVPEISVVSNLPSIQIEEVAPVGTSDANLLAPEEIKEKNKGGDVKGDTEKTTTDKKRERKKKKKMKSLRMKEKEKRRKLREEQNPSLSNKLSRAGAAEKLKKLTRDGKTTLLKDDGKDKALRTSQAFFSQLQDQVKMELKGAKSKNNKKKRGAELSASRLKL
ncbi:U3 small nucleolar ribonucleoprotein protein MPP10 [Callorhinchus milii]|uniref:U3 small nucleolar ribonucleoprotein protein MPP10 n=1 Tax=Callorhinchus milii TaxID=7868 RepID=UPI001C3FAE7D|nr:U3 small nucleolar ribonucleoprotein protein MPP10 [Callorhinchus milii]